MTIQSCVACGGHLNALQREGIVRKRARSLSSSAATYPVVYRLLQKLQVCAGCLEALPFIGEQICRQCGRDMCGEVICRDGLCRDCVDRASVPLSNNRSLLQYDEKGKSLVSLFKYRGDERLASFFSALLTIAIYRYHHTPSRFTCITTVPLHPTRLRERGFNQVELLAKALGHAIGVPVKTLLERTKATEKLSKQGGRVHREESMRDAFAWAQGAVLADLSSACSGGIARAKVKGGANSPVMSGTPLRVLLIDDIYTTGSTLRSCASTLRAHLGTVCEIYSLTIYR
ncbi:MULTISPECIES: ComF family protein [Brevibacillus]|uniref:Amidophosphoribosyltransferase n=1 Tax=Brevibacillus parabrevis TaxID=54914 RepID=A0A4Y3PLR9_BREPA|nr:MULTISPECIES: ComF family protein [Brevibacillus]NRQ53456.1 ComF family protein [Brevibacillus sp. HD1.4A]MDR9506592.1 ComF family protein [Brevibacillus agri]MED2256156.1 ComF family protein [Brevibacillus parabrevis]RNB97341.1 ComF family protein [Brevibacillus parabrevis]WDV94972.1 ComF family protein [Brevibacillus parabrevis]